VKEGLTAQELADAGAQDLASISSAGEGRLPRALELHLPPLASSVHDLAHVHGSSVTKLAREIAKLDTNIPQRALDT
jgi:hypothetical protein